VLDKLEENTVTTDHSSRSFNRRAWELIPFVIRLLCAYSNLIHLVVRALCSASLSVVARSCRLPGRRHLSHFARSTYSSGIL